MEKEFIPYEQALALKELGFDEPCFAYYNGYKELDHLMPERVVVGRNYNGDTITSAPLYQQAFRWFREKFKISGEITSSFYSEGEENEWEFNIYQLDKEDEEYNTLPIFKSYEEAEFECLKKLIEIVKEK
jgi:hypothetical protein